MLEEAIWDLIHSLNTEKVNPKKDVEMLLDTLKDELNIAYSNEKGWYDIRE